MGQGVTDEGASVACGIWGGRNVGIYSSNWLPRPNTFTLIYQPYLPTDFLVADLILNGNDWNVFMLRQYF